MPIKPILLLGNPDLYKVCEEVKQSELESVQSIMADLHDTLFDFRARYNAGRAIAAPQIGVFKRIVYMHIDRPTIFINPVLSGMSDRMFELWDDCLSFPDLLVKVRRHKSCHIEYRGLEWKQQTLDLEDDLSELLQHECDHLDGILAVQRAIDSRSFALKGQRSPATG